MCWWAYPCASPTKAECSSIVCWLPNIFVLKLFRKGQMPPASLSLAIFQTPLSSITFLFNYLIFHSVSFLSAIGFCENRVPGPFLWEGLCSEVLLPKSQELAVVNRLWEDVQHSLRKREQRLPTTCYRTAREPLKEFWFPRTVFCAFIENLQEKEMWTCAFNCCQRKMFLSLKKGRGQNQNTWFNGLVHFRYLIWLS